MIILLKHEATEEGVRAVADAVQELGLGTVPLDDARGRAFEVVGADPSRVLGLRHLAAVEEILTRRTPLAGGEPVWPHFTLRVVILTLVLLAVLALLAAYLPIGLEDPARPTLAPGPVVKEWYLRPLHALLDLVGMTATRITVGLFWVFFFFWPFLDRADPATPRGRKTILGLRVLGVALIVLLIALGLRG